jgi:Double zinc ribbon
MQDDRDREQQASSSEPRDEETAEEFETAPSSGHASTEAPPAEAPPAEAEPMAAESTEPETPAEAIEPPSSGPVDWPDADAEAVPSVPAAEAEPERAPVEWPDEPAGPPPGEAEAYPTAPPAVAEPVVGEPAHSVPATPIGESTQCPRCGTENRPGIAFCRNCGQRLVAAGVPTTVERPGTPEGTQQCPRCGTHNRAGVAFCQNCGANLRASATPAPGYVPPPVPNAASGAPQVNVGRAGRGGAMLGPIVLIVGALGIVTAWLLPFPYGVDSLWERSFGSVGGYGVGFWNGYSLVSGGVLDDAYFGFAAAAPLLVALLLLLAIGGFLRAAPGVIQVGGLLIAFLWAVGLGATFLILEVGGNWNGSLIDLLRALSPAGIIFLLASLIVIIGAITRLARS